ncbi:MAG: hypothetical protein N3C12_07555 [Candidatus Binatia bacterium]|nr:hypothetical protein [Candidatus Binatia bacterium]
MPSKRTSAIAVRRLPFVLLWPIFVFITAGCGSDGEAPEALIRPATTEELLRPGPYGVGFVETVLEDRSRPTMANRSFPGSDRRVLPATVWYPTTDSSRGLGEQRAAPFAATAAPAPVVVYSHGFLSNRRGGAYIAQHLVTHGFVVAAVDFPLSSFSAPGGATLGDLANQPGDVSFLLNALLHGTEAAFAFLAGRLDPQRVGLTGLSLGGATTLLTTFHPTLRDPRVRAAVAYAPPACFLGPRFYATASVPLALVHGDLDAIVPYAEHALFAFQQAGPPKYLFTLKRGNHTAFTDGADVLFGQMQNADDLGCSALGSALANDPAAVNFAQNLGGAEAGIVSGNCPIPCARGPSNPPAMAPQRQLALAKAIALAHFEAWLRGSVAARLWEEQQAQAENSDLEVFWTR